MAPMGKTSVLILSLECLADTSTVRSLTSVEVAFSLHAVRAAAAASTYFGAADAPFLP